MQIHTLDEAKLYLEEHIRMDVFTRYDADKHLKTPLERIEYFLSLIGDPQKKYASVQVTGTSGKGSTSYLLSHILTTAGYTTGFTLSPHLQEPHERLQVNNIQATDQEFIDTLNKVIPAIEQMSSEPIGKPSYFEILMAMAFQYFADKKVAITVAEVGLEGKYDATNVLEPLVVIFANISLDHTAILGDTIEKIAGEAVSAIKQQSSPQTVITGALQPSIYPIVEHACQIAGARMWTYQKDFLTAIQSVEPSKTIFTYSTKEYELADLELSLKGDYQVDNAALAIAAASKLREKGYLISDEHIRQALRTAFFPGRFEIFEYKGKTVILDGAHNDAKMEAFLQALTSYYPEKKKVFLVGFKKDKNVKGMLEKIIPVASKISITRFQKTTDQSKNFSMDPEEVLHFISHEKDTIPSYSDSATALDKIVEDLEKDSLLIVTGSLYLIGELREKITSQN